MASQPRAAGKKHGGVQGGNSRSSATKNIAEDVLAMCPSSMGTGLLVDDTDIGRSQRVKAVARIKGLLEQVKANIKVCWCWCWCWFLVVS